jgi:hypothetical protein
MIGVHGSRNRPGYAAVRPPQRRCVNALGSVPRCCNGSPLVRIAYKLILALALAIALIWIVGLYGTSVGQESLREAIQRTSAGDASSATNEILPTIHTRIATGMTYTHI